MQKSNQEVDGICVGVSAIQNIPVGALVQYVESLRDNYVKTFDDLVTLMMKLGSRCFVNSLSLNGILTLGILYYERYRVRKYCWRQGPTQRLYTFVQMNVQRLFMYECTLLL